MDLRRRAALTEAAPQNDDARRLIGAAALVLVGLTFVEAARRSSDLGAVAFTEVPGVAAWLFLALLISLAAADPTAAHRIGGGTTAGLLVGAAALHGIAWWSDSAWFRLLASGLACGAVLVAAARWVRHTSDALTIAGLGSIVASVMLATSFLIDAAVARADAVSASPAALLDARGPALAAVAVLVGMGLVEAGLPGERRLVEADVAGTVQVLLFGTGWAALLTSAATDNLSLGVSAVGLHVLAVIVFLVRTAARLSPRQATTRDARWPSVALVAAAAYVGLLVHLVVGLVDGSYADASSIPGWLEVAVDLTAFAGLTGNGLIWLVLRSAGRTTGRREFVVLVAYNGALVATTVGAAVDAGVIVRVGLVSMAVSTIAVSAVVARPAGAVTSDPGHDTQARLQSGTRSW